MFTGIVREIGRVEQVARQGGGMRLTICSTSVRQSLAVGDSVSIDGVCLTVATLTPKGFQADVIPETLRKTQMGSLSPNERVNLEPALRIGDMLGGHFVTGHIDCTGTVTELVEAGADRLLAVQFPTDFMTWVIPQGSIAVDGVSLTVAAVLACGIRVALIPHTLENTALGALKSGERVNLEFDLLGKYAVRWSQARIAPSRISEPWLQEIGWSVPRLPTVFSRNQEER